MLFRPVLEEFESEYQYNQIEKFLKIIKIYYIKHIEKYEQKVDFIFTGNLIELRKVGTSKQLDKSYFYFNKFLNTQKIT